MVHTERSSEPRDALYDTIAQSHGAGSRENDALLTVSPATFVNVTVCVPPVAIPSENSGAHDDSCMVVGDATAGTEITRIAVIPASVPSSLFIIVGIVWRFGDRA